MKETVFTKLKKKNIKVDLKLHLKIVAVIVFVVTVFLCINTVMKTEKHPLKTVWDNEITEKRLEFVCLKNINLEYSQNQTQHFKRNGYIAYDIVCDTTQKNSTLYAPSYMYLDDEGVLHDEKRTYIASIEENENTMGLTVVLKWKEGDKDMSWHIGHMSQVMLGNRRKIQTGDVIGISGGSKDNLQFNEKSSGPHTHIEIRQGNVPIFYPFKQGVHKDELARIKLYKERFKSEKGAAWRIENGYALSGDNKIYKRCATYREKLTSAFHAIESGRRAKNCYSSYKDARGCLQIVKNTFKEYATDGNNDNIIDVDNLCDSIATADNYINTLYYQEFDHVVKMIKDSGGVYDESIHEDWVIFRIACRYNSGYKYNCTHKNTPNSIVDYSNRVVNLYNNF